MDITIHSSFLPHDDPEASLAFYRDTLGFEVRTDVGSGKMPWITVGPADQPGTSIVLHPPEATPGITDAERRTIAEMMAKGTYAGINLATPDLDETFEQLQARDDGVVRLQPLEHRVEVLGGEHDAGVGALGHHLADHPALVVGDAGVRGRRAQP